MPRTAVSVLRLIPAPDTGPPDEQLLRAFVAARGEDVFAEIVRRHGPMVLAACRRVLGNADDAEDAFQAVFLVLARKAATIRGSNLAGWLYAVAVRTARGVRIMRDRRRKHELRANSDRQGVGAVTATPDGDLAAVIDEELARLPENYREAVVMCELRGLSRKQAAAEIGIPEGTLSSRLATAKRRLAARLSARGLSVPAALAAVLAPASVSSALVRSAVAATHGLAAPVASAVATAIVKAMLFDQVKTIALAAGLLLTVACGGWAMSGMPGDNPASAVSGVENPVVKLVQQLGAPEFADRESAQTELRQLGAKAQPALQGALKSENPEIRNRAAKVLLLIRRDVREAFVKEFDPSGSADYDHPVWKRFRTIAGSGAPARKLFAEIIADPRSFRLLDDAEHDPEQAGDIYAAEVDRVFAAIQKVLNMPTTGEPDPKTVPWPAQVTTLYLGTYASSTGKVKDGWAREGHTLLAESRGLWDKAPGSAPALKRVFAAWLLRRDHPTTLERGLGIAVTYGFDSLLPLARTVAADTKNPAKLRLAALAAVAQFGTPADLPLFEALFADETPVATSIENRTGFGSMGRRIITQARDAAAGMALLLHGVDPLAHGFWQASGRWERIGERPDLARYELSHFGFHEGFEKQRADAHAKVKGFLDKQPKPKKEEPKPEADVKKLVVQLGAEDFADREAAQKELRALGAKAEAALKAALKSESPEVRERAAKVLGEIRADARDALARQFDPKKTDKYDHPVWKKFVAIAGDSPASRELFARIIANRKWLRTLDNAEADPTNGGHLYMVGIAEVFRDFYNDPAKSRPWPCDRPEEVAYLLFLGSFADIPTTEPKGDEIIPDDPRRLSYLGRGIIRGEEQIIHANGITLGLEGKWLKWQTQPAVPGTDRVFARLFVAWLTRHDPASTVVPRGLRTAGRELLPFARKIAANNFEPKREIPPLATITALEMVARFGTSADLPLFDRHFSDETNVAGVDKARTDGAKDYYRPAPVIDTTQMRDVALGLALLLHGASPADFGFVVREDTFKQEDGRYLVPGPIQLHLGFDSEASRSSAFKKAKEWLAQQPKPEPKKADPPGKGAKMWPRFAKVIGEDAASRALFDLIVASPRNRELLETVTDKPDVAARLYHDRWVELNKAAQISTGMVGSYRLEQAPLADVLGWFYLGTFPGAEGSFHQSHSLDFLQQMPSSKSSRDELGVALQDKSLSAPLRRLLGKWTAARVDYSGRAFGLQMALAYDIREVLPAASETLAARVKDDPYPGNTAQNVGFAMLVVGKLGTKEDLPLLERYAKDQAVCAKVLNDPPPKPGEPIIRLPRPAIEGQDATAQLRDVSAAMRLHLRGQKPEEFGFYWARPFGPDKGKSWVKPRDAFYLYGIGFLREADREAAHNKAREWLEKEKK